MQFLTRDQVAAWIGHALPRALGGACDETAPPTALLSDRFSYPSDSGRKTWLAKAITHELARSSGVLVHVKCVDIWPSSGHLPLLGRLRQSWGETRSIDDTPGHVFPAAELDDAISLIVLAMQFYWDCLIVSEDHRLAVFFSHDEFGDIFSRDAAGLEALKGILGL